MNRSLRKKKNELTLTVPEIPDKEVLTKLKDHPMWRQFDGRCISCGACTVACSTCTCFTTTDIIYNENRNVGERKRTSASCQVKDFTDMAGGMSFRNRPGTGCAIRCSTNSTITKPGLRTTICVWAADVVWTGVLSTYPSWLQ